MDAGAPRHEGRDQTERDGADAPEEGGVRRSRSVRMAGGAGLVALVLLLVSTFVVQPFLIPSASMSPTLRVGDRVVVNKLAYRFGNHPQRGDVVVFDGTGSFVEEEPEGDPVVGLLRAGGALLGLTKQSETDYVKRVVGVGGDRVRCCDERGRLEVNGVPVTEEYLYEGDEASSVPFDVQVPEGRLWTMGDHRSDSSDSRDHLGSPGGGTVPVDAVIGRVDWICWPPGRWTSLTHGPSYAHASADGRG